MNQKQGKSVSHPWRSWLAVPAILVLAASFDPCRCQAQTASEVQKAAGIGQLVSGTTVLVAKIDPQQVQLPSAITDMIGVGNASDNWPARIEKSLAWLLNASGGEAVLATVDVPFSDSANWFSIHFVRNDEIDVQQLSDTLKELQFTGPTNNASYVSFSAGPANVPGVSNTIESEIISHSRLGLAPAFEAIEEFPIQIAILPPTYVWRTLRELQPQLPKQIGGGPSSLLTEGVQWAAIGVDPASLNLEAVIQSGSSESARALSAHIPHMLSALVDQLPKRNFSTAKQLSRQLLGSLATSVRGDQVHLALDGIEILKPGSNLLALITNQILTPISHRSKIERFKRLSLAMLNHESAFAVFPPIERYRGQDGECGLSWRVFLLPFLGENELYKQFNLEQAWDSPHNLPLVDKMPDVFSTPSADLLAPTNLKPGHTTFLAPVGEGTVAGGSEVVRISRIVDGTSNTLFFVDVRPELAVPWTAPMDYRYDPKDPAAGCAVASDGKFVTARADGSVSTLRGDIPVETLLHLFQMNDGQPVQW